MRLTSLLLAGALLARVPLPGQTASPVPATPTLTVKANLVVVPVTVRDSKDRLIRTLTREDFTLTVDGKAQPIRYFDREDDLPLTLGLLVDVSGSQRTVLDEERTASTAFLDGMLKPGRDSAFVVQFGRSADLLADITQSVPRLQSALQKIDGDGGRPAFRSGGQSDPQDNSGNNSGDNSRTDDPQNGGDGQHGGRRGGRGTRGAGTVLYDAVFLSNDEVLKKTARGQAQTRNAVILLTDGEDRGSRESVAEAIEAAQRADTTIYAIYYRGEEQRDRGFGGTFPGGRSGGFPVGRGGGFPGGGGGGYPGRGGGGERVDGKKILERMADETGGRVYEVSHKLPLTEIYRQIAEELRSQYRLGFSPANTEAGYHRLTVDTPGQKKAILQARDGYYTGSEK